MANKLKMPSLAQVAIHPSQFPEAVRLDLIESLRSRAVNHKFHYDSVKQTQKWLTLHQLYSPSRTDPDCAATYDRSFIAAAARISGTRVHLVGLGCGGGQKDARLLQLLRDRGKEVFYTPCDVSIAMVLVARQAALAVIPEANCFPLVCDLASTSDIAEAFTAPIISGTVRLITFFGMIPNFEPALILPRLARLVRPGENLLLSTNLAPGSDYGAGVRRILPLYDNDPTREWLMNFLLDLGVEPTDGKLRFVIENDPPAIGLKRVAAYFEFGCSREIQVDSERFEFRPGDSLRLFFSYRYTPALVHQLVSAHGLQVTAEWITQSQEEGVFLVSRDPG